MLPTDANIINIIVHPEYHPPKKYNDIALMELENHVQFNKFIQPGCLWTKFSTNSLGTEATLTGWGVVETGKNSLTLFILYDCTFDLLVTSATAGQSVKFYKIIKNHQIIKFGFLRNNVQLLRYGVEFLGHIYNAWKDKCDSFNILVIYPRHSITFFPKR